MYCRDSVFCEFTWENVARRGFKGHILQWVYRATAVTSDLVIAGNQSAKTLLVKAGISPQKILVTGQLGIRGEHFPIASGEQKQSWRTSLGWPEDALVIGFCGRLVPEKGILFLYAAAARLHRSFPKIRLAYLGSGPLETTLLENDTTAGILKILPPVPHLEVGNFLNKLDIFVLPSIPLETPSQVWEEQFGHVLIEAIVAGALTLGSDSGAIPEILADPEVTFQHSNLDALEKNLHRWVQSPSEITEKANRQKHDCLLAWSFDVLAARYATFLKFPPLHSTSTDSKS